MEDNQKIGCGEEPVVRAPARREPINFPPIASISSIKDSMRIRLDKKEMEFERQLLRVSYQFIHSTLEELSMFHNTGQWQPHHRLLYRWMESVVERGRSGALAPGSRAWSKTSAPLKKKLESQISAEPAGLLTCRVGKHLARIVRGEINALELMTEGGLLDVYYQEMPRLKSRSYKHLDTVARVLAPDLAGATILEVGAGTGGATAVVVEAIAAESRINRYDYTDISPGFFDSARRKFARFQGLMDFKKLDVEDDPVPQSFGPGGYDLVVASLCLHATRNLGRTMSHVRKLLRPNGLLLLVETTQDRLDTQLIFGTLPGWWLAEEPERRNSANGPLALWDRVLREAGFSGIDFEIGDCEESEFQSISVMLSTANP